jgi:hypothetical protein
MPPILKKGMGCFYILKYFYKEFLCVLSDGQILYGTSLWGIYFDLQFYLFFSLLALGW